MEWQKRYIYSLEKETIQSLQTLYFDSLTFEQRSESQFLDRRKEEIDEVKQSEKVQLSTSKHQENLVHIQEHLKKLQLAKEAQNDTTKQDGVDAIDEGDEEFTTGSSGNESDDQADETSLYARASTPTTAVVDDDELESTISFMATKSPLVLFSSPSLPNDKCFGVYKTLISAEDSPNYSPLAHLESFSISKPLTKDPLTSGISCVLLLSAGHFAGAIISHLPHSTKGNSGSPQQLHLQSVRLLEHKTFHRYTTRRKQGGSQSAMDDAKGKANSAGSNLRRYNEQALGQDIDGLLHEWKPLLDICDHIFIKASGKLARLVIKQPSESGAVILAGDERVKSIPFGTNRPTVSEIRRVWNELTYLSICDLPKVSTEEIAKIKKRQLALEKSQKQASAEKKNVEIDHQSEIISLLKKSKAPALVMYLKKHKLDTNFNLNDPTYSTMLHFASAQGLNHMVKTLLWQLKANPSILNDKSQSAFDIAGQQSGDKKLTELEFSLAKHEHPELDWSQAGSIHALSTEEVAKLKDQIKKEKLAQEDELKNSLKQSMDQAMQEKLNDIKANKKLIHDKKFGQGRPLVAMPKEEQKLAGLTDEQRMKVMREQRLRAIEARMKKL